MINTQIKTVYYDLFAQIAINSNYAKQLDFLKIYPIYIKKEVILDLWIKQYIEACYDQEITVLSKKIKGNSFRRSIKLKNSASFLANEKFYSKKVNLLNFLITGLSKNLIDKNVNKIKIIIKLLIEYEEDTELINLIKLEMLKEDNNKIVILPQKHDNIYISQPLTETNLTVENRNQPVDFLKIDAKKFATELTRIFSNNFSRLSIHEMISVSKGNCSLDFHMNFLTTEFNRMSHLVPATLLVSGTTQKQRINIIKKFIKIAQVLKRLNNFQGLFAIIAGLNNNSIRRIKNLWELDSKYYSNLEQLEKFVSPSKNFSNYRRYLKNINPDLSVLPYLGVIISDLNHTLENSLIDDTGNIDFQIYDMIASIINNYDSLRKYYKINENKQISHFINNISDNINDAILYKLSLYITDEELHNELQKNKSKLLSGQKDNK